MNQIKTLTYINSLGEEIVFTNSAPLLLEKFDTSENVNIYSNKGMSQDGNTYLNNSLDIRDISLAVAVIATNEEELISYRNMINKIFNPKYGEGYLIYKDSTKERKIRCIVNKIPYFSVLNIIVNKCLISLTANNPFWTDILESKEEIALWKGDFSFSEDGFDGFEITEQGIEMGHREPSLIVNVKNNGNVGCGMRVEFKALATLTNPSILNVNTGEYIKINKSMIAGEILSISSYFGNKRVESILNGITSNAFNYIDFQSTFLQLDTGDNLLRYDASTGLDNLEVSIYYMPQYLGV